MTPRPTSCAPHCAVRLAGYKQPKELHQRDDIPRSANGKVRRLFLADELGLP